MSRLWVPKTLAVVAAASIAVYSAIAPVDNSASLHRVPRNNNGYPLPAASPLQHPDQAIWGSAGTGNSAAQTCYARASARPVNFSQPCKQPLHCCPALSNGK